MKRERRYDGVRFKVDVLREALTKWEALLLPPGQRTVVVPEGALPYSLSQSRFVQGRDSWWPNSPDEYLAEYARGQYEFAHAHFSSFAWESFDFTDYGTWVEVSVTLPNDLDNREVLKVFDEAEDRSRIPVDDLRAKIARDVEIFIAHGRARRIDAHEMDALRAELNKLQESALNRRESLNEREERVAYLRSAQGGGSLDRGGEGTASAGGRGDGAGEGGLRAGERATSVVSGR